MAKNRPSKDKRQARNKARREALAARAEAAREREREERRAAGGDGTAAAPRRGMLSRLFNPSGGGTPASGGSADGGSQRSAREPRPAPVRGRPEGPMPRDERGRVPGHRAALFSLFFSVSAAGLLIFVPISFEREIDSVADAPEGCEIVTTTTTTTPDGDGEPDGADEEASQLTCEDSSTIVSEFGPLAILLLAVPVGITGAAYWATTRERQARIWTFSLLGLAAYLVLVSVVGFLFLPSMVALTIASFQSRRAEQKLLIAQRASGDPSEGDEVIDTTASEVSDADNSEDEEPAD